MEQKLGFEEFTSNAIIFVNPSGRGRWEGNNFHSKLGLARTCVMKMVPPQNKKEPHG